MEAMELSVLPDELLGEILAFVPLMRLFALTRVSSLFKRYPAWTNSYIIDYNILKWNPIMFANIQYDVLFGELWKAKSRRRARQGLQWRF